MFIRNCWYVVAWEHEIPHEGFFTRTALGDPLLLFRTRSGDVAALLDRCCHRHAPLSKGRREGDCVRCGYHGLKFDARGQCVAVPGMAQPPKAARVRSYPVSVKNRWVFVWMGDPALADEALLPDNFSCGDPAWRHEPGYLHYAAPYLLICDNLLDFSHLSYVHEKTLGGSTEIALARPQIDAIPHGMRVTRHVQGVPPPPYYARIQHFDGPIDRWFIYDFVLPGTLLMHSGGRPAGVPADDIDRAVQLHSCQTLTPETESTTHYFFQQAHRSDTGDEGLAGAIHASLLAAFDEDREMLAAQARCIASAGDAPMLPLHFDAALLRFRRLVDEALARESTVDIESPRARVGADA
jgi:phenylpropionate dioxygenase-like ring-hydroxylating dioxygenase large terminal subunit